MNGCSRGFFKSEKGLRQGDLILPLIFILAAEYLSRGLNMLFKKNSSMAYLSRNMEVVTHLAFADDVIIFVNGSKPALRKVM